MCFDLTIECGNLDVAVEMAKAINQNECWEQAQQALKQGNHVVHWPLTPISTALIVSILF